MDSSQPSRLADLPEEVLQNILRHADPQTAIALGQVARRFRHATEEPLLWKTYCLSAYQYWSDRHGLKHKLVSKEYIDWKDTFLDRQNSDDRVIRALNGIIDTKRGRMDHFDVFVECGYDAKDVLLRELRVSPDATDFLARRYWAYWALGMIHRNAALKIWEASGRPHTHGLDLRLEQCLGAFDVFIRGADVEGLSDVTNRLDQIAETLRAEKPGILDLTERQRSIAIADFLRRHTLVGMRPGQEYHALQNNFLGMALASDDHNALPLISVAIFCSLCTRFDLKAKLCNFPFHVYAMVYPKDGYDLDGNMTSHTIEPMFLDPWRSSEEVTVSSLREYISMLPNIDRVRSVDDFLIPASIPEISLRCARNITMSIEQSNPQRHPSDCAIHRINILWARYAALWATIVLAAPQPSVRLTTPNQVLPIHQQIVNLLHLFASDFPYDTKLVEAYLLPIMENVGGRYLNDVSSIRNIRIQDSRPQRYVKRRSHYSQYYLKYKVGQVFEHNRYGYRGVITGWDAKCEAREEWIEGMGVDRLADGRNQPFYIVLVINDLTIRYVASESIKILQPPETDNVFPDPPYLARSTSLHSATTTAATNEASECCCPFPQPGDFELEVGKWFRRWDKDQGVFVSNLVDEYPED